MKSFEHQCLDFWRSKPAGEEYDYTESWSCALTQFVTESGIGKPSPEWRCTGEESLPCWEDSNGETHVYHLTVIHAAIRDPMTFGAAADRLEKLLQP